MGFGIYVNPLWCIGDGDFSAGAMTGYTRFSIKEEFSNSDINLIPLLGTLKYRFFETGFRPLVGLGVGTATVRSQERTFYPLVEVKNYTKTIFCYNFQAGFECDIILERFGISVDGNYTAALGKGALVSYTGINAGLYYIWGEY